jgi:hypothetical protein
MVAGREPVASLQHGDAAVQPVITYVHPIQPGVHTPVRLEAVFAGVLPDVAGVLPGECGLGLQCTVERFTCQCAAARVLPPGARLIIHLIY